MPNVAAWSGIILGALVLLGVGFFAVWRVVSWFRTEVTTMAAATVPEVVKAAIETHSRDDGAHVSHFSTVRAIALTARGEAIQTALETISKHDENANAHAAARASHPTKGDFAGFAERIEAQMEAFQHQLMESANQRREEIRMIHDMLDKDRDARRTERKEDREVSQRQFDEFRRNVIDLLGRAIEGGMKS